MPGHAKVLTYNIININTSNSSFQFCFKDCYAPNIWYTKGPTPTDCCGQQLVILNGSFERLSNASEHVNSYGCHPEESGQEEVVS